MDKLKEALMSVSEELITLMGTDLSVRQETIMLRVAQKLNIVADEYIINSALVGPKEPEREIDYREGSQ